MSNLDPSIANVMRGRMNVGSDNIRHAHHIGRREADPATEVVHTDETVPDVSEVNPGVVKGLFDSALKRIRGGGYDSTKT